MKYKYLLMVLAILYSFYGAPAWSATFTVDDTGDAGDNNIGDGNCATAGAVCTLRAAVEEANGAAGSDTIQFDNTTFSSATTITLATELQINTNGSVTIDGTANGVTAHNVVVVGDSGSPCISLDTASNVIKGLTIQGGKYGIYLNSASSTGNKIQNNYIGTDYLGTTSAANVVGVYVGNGSANFIGTDGDGSNDASEGNVISGNTSRQVQLEGSGSNTVAGNYIGPGSDGTTDLGVGDGVYVMSNNNIIGTNGDGVSDSDEKNVMSGFNVSGSNFGVSVGTYTGNRISGNYIGLTADGLSTLPNNYGVSLPSTAAVTIGTNGDGVGDASEKNYISGNSGSQQFLLQVFMTQRKTKALIFIIFIA